MFVVFERRCQEACGSSCYSAPEATITLLSISLSTRYNVDRPTPNAFVARRLAALQQIARHLDLMCRQLRLPATSAPAGLDRHQPGPGDLAPSDRTRSDVCHAASFMSISAWA